MLVDQVRAISIAGIETCISIPSWNLAFDIGRCPTWAQGIPKIFFTHAHMDHLGGVAQHCATRELLGSSPPDYFLPSESAEGLEEVLAAWRQLDKSSLECNGHALAPGHVQTLTATKKVVSFRAVHRLPTLGYALISSKKKLKVEFQGVPGKDLGDARKKGIAIEDVVESVDVAFCGDTTIDVLKREELPRKARLLILECTYLDDAVSVLDARRAGHVHLDQLIENADLFENEEILLTHFSARYSAQQIRDILSARLPESLRSRVTPLLVGFE